MLVEERTINVGGAECSLFVPCSKGATFNGQSLGIGSYGTDRNLGAFQVDGFRTYKRRKHSGFSSKSNLQEDSRIPIEIAGQSAEQTIKEPLDKVLYSNSCEQNGFSRIDRPHLPEGSDDSLHGHWRNVVLKHILQSLDVSEGGIQSCIQDALASSPFGSIPIVKMHVTSDQIAQAQEFVHCHKDRQKCHLQVEREPEISDRSVNVVKEHKSHTLDGFPIEPNDQANVHVITELCQRAFHNVIASEKFTLLCKLLCENFQGIKVDNFSNFSVINSRMKEGAYGQSPILFSTDIQQVWRKFQKIGTELVALAKSLSDMSRTSYLEQVGGLVNGICGEEKQEEINQVSPEKDYLGLVTTERFLSQESDQYPKPEQAETCGLVKVGTCMHCGAKADGKDCLICDSCEEMYHVSCIEPTVEEIPPRSWYCANCTASGIESPHENCAVCERLNDPRTQTHENGDETEAMAEEMVSNLEENSDCSMEAEAELQLPSGSRTLHSCKLCGSGEVDGQKFRICGHLLCPNKYYHVRCLTSQQLKSYGPCWYCPSCLCRACLNDQDDDKIVLCDSCDHAYHIYCMKPPRTSIPRGKWFCSQCDVRIQAIHKAKREYEINEKQKRKNSSGAANAGVGSVDMLLSAAEKLKYEEKLAATESKR